MSALRCHLLISFLKALVISSIVSLSSQASEILVYRNESMPWCGTVDGKDVGMTVDILNAVTRLGGPKFKFQSVPWKRAQTLVQNMPNAAIIPLTRTPSRENLYTWIIALVPNQIRFTLAKNPIHKVSITNPLTLANAKSLSVAVLRGSAIIPSLDKLGVHQITEVNQIEQAAHMLRLGRVDAMVESKWVDHYAWHQIGQEQSNLVSGPNIGDVQFIYLAAAPNFPPELTHQIRLAMTKVKKSGELDEILNRWSHP